MYTCWCQLPEPYHFSPFLWSGDKELRVKRLTKKSNVVDFLSKLLLFLKLSYFLLVCLGVHTGLKFLKQYKLFKRIHGKFRKLGSFRIL